jgi:soluble lytic murein transglycosylase
MAWALTFAGTVEAAPLAPDDPLAPMSAELRRARALVRLRYCEQGLAALDRVNAQGAAWKARAQVLRATCELHLGKGQAALAALEAGGPLSSALAPHAALLRARAHTLLGAGDEALAALEDTKGEYGPTELAVQVARAEALEAAGRRKEALAAWKRLASTQGRGVPRPHAWERVALLHDALGDDAGGRSAREHLLLRFPASDEAGRAASKVAPAQLTPAERWTRAMELWDERAYDLALDAFAPFASAGAHQHEANLLMGRLLSERLRERYPDALAHFEKAAQAGDREIAGFGAFKAALTLGKLRRYDDAVAKLRKFRAQFPGHPDHDEAGFEIGRHLMEQGQFAAAASALDEWLAGASVGDSAKFRWFQAWALLRGQKWEAALSVLRKLEGSQRTLVGDKAGYWKGHALAALGKREEAHRAWQRVIDEYPFSYYAWAAERQRERAGAPAKVPSPDFSGLAAEPAYAHAALAEARGAAKSQLIAVWDLASIGEVTRASELFSASRGAIQAAVGASDANAIEQGWTQALENFYAPRKAAIGKYGELKAQYPSERTVEGWRAIFPLAYRDLAEAASEQEGLPPYQLYAHMLQESRYGPHMVSGAKAYGLIQILPSTARLIAKDIGLVHRSPDELFDVAVNVRMGAYYLGALAKRFGDQLPLSIAAYNGGPRLLSFHMKQYPGLDLEALLESLPAHQSRNYARKVLEHMHRYAAIYGTPKDRVALMSRAAGLTASYADGDAPSY